MEKNSNYPLNKSLADCVENKYLFILKASKTTKELQKKYGKEKTKEEILEMALLDTLKKEDDNKTS